MSRGARIGTSTIWYRIPSFICRKPEPLPADWASPSRSENGNGRGWAVGCCVSAIASPWGLTTIITRAPMRMPWLRITDCTVALSCVAIASRNAKSLESTVAAVSSWRWFCSSRRWNTWVPTTSSRAVSFATILLLLLATRATISAITSISNPTNTTTMRRCRVRRIIASIGSFPQEAWAWPRAPGRRSPLRGAAVRRWP